MSKRILIIDSHKGSITSTNNLHLQNAQTIASRIGAKVIWSYPGVNDDIESDFDVIIFNHASHYNFVDYEWVKKSPNARLITITNEYNLGESRILWMALKRDGRTHEVIANHDSKISKIVTKYTTAWHNLNLNSLIYNPDSEAYDWEAQDNKKNCIYYGSYRKGREKYFKQYLGDTVVVSTHSKNREKFNALGISPNYINRIDWKKDGLAGYKYSLYIEDEITHTNYNHLANRFYEALNYNVIPLFGEECYETVKRSGIPIKFWDYCVSNTAQIKHHLRWLPDVHWDYMPAWKEFAQKERENTLKSIEEIITK